MTDTRDPIELPHKPRKGEALEVAIDSVGVRGDGVGTIDVLVGPQREPMTLDAHVRRTIPGDVVRARVARCRRRRLDGWVEEILEPSPMRQTPPCSHFPDRDDRPGCGGCSLQLLDYRHQLVVKERRLKAVLATVGIDAGLVEPVASAGDGLYYRNKMEFEFAGSGEEFSVGMHPAGFKYETIHHRECLLMSEFVSEFIGEATRWAAQFSLEPYRREGGFWRTITIREGKNTGERMFALGTSHLEPDGPLSARDVAGQFADWLNDEYGAEVTSVYWTQCRAIRGEPTEWFEHHLAGRKSLREELTVAGQTLSFEIAPRSFFQTNTRGAELLYEIVVDELGASDVDVALDLYSGTGTIALCLAGAVDRVIGIELVEDAVANARENAATNGIDNVEFHAGDVGEVLADLRPEASVVVVDPPRVGLLPQAHAELRQIDAERLVYVSCNPDALARDLGELTSAGWSIDRIRPVDMFPQTAHVETVVTLTRQ